MQTNKNHLFIIWGMIVIFLIALLTILGFMITKNNKPYHALEEKLKLQAEKYGNTEFIYNENVKEMKVTSEELIEKEYLDELKTVNDTCIGYVKVTLNTVYEYKAYIKCNHYQTKGYE